MKSLTFLFLAGLQLVAAAPRPQHDHGGMGTGAVPAGCYLEPQLDVKKGAKTPGAQLHKTRYGPYNVAAGGMMSNKPVTGVKEPCSECDIVAINAGLEYADGSVANVNTGAWLHHMVVSVRGTGKENPVCRGMSIMGARWFASGNERAVARTNIDGNYAFKFNRGDSISMLVDLMNSANTAKTLYLTVTFEYMPRSMSRKEATVAWLDVTGCGGSEVPATGKSGKFSLKSPGWRSTLSGTMLYATGHVHDAGTATAIYQNGKEVCVSTQLYGRTPEYISPEGAGHGGHKRRDGGGGMHISDSCACRNFGQLRRGDDLVVEARYDTNSAPLAMHGDKLEGIMGISRIIIGTD